MTTTYEKCDMCGKEFPTFAGTAQEVFQQVHLDNGTHRTVSKNLCTACAKRVKEFLEEGIAFGMPKNPNE